MIKALLNRKNTVILAAILVISYVIFGLFAPMDEGSKPYKHGATIIDPVEASGQIRCEIPIPDITRNVQPNAQEIQNQF